MQSNAAGRRLTAQARWVEQQTAPAAAKAAEEARAATRRRLADESYFADVRRSSDAAWSPADPLPRHNGIPDLS